MVALMIIRPLKRIEKGYYISADKEWEFVDQPSGWYAYSLDNDLCGPYFYEPYPTLKLLVKAVETAVKTITK
jgi:hypothetical protein